MQTYTRHGSVRAQTSVSWNRSRTYWRAFSKTWQQAAKRREGDLNSRALASNRSRIYRLTGLGHPGLTLDMFSLKLIIQAKDRMARFPLKFTCRIQDAIEFPCVWSILCSTLS